VSNTRSPNACKRTKVQPLPPVPGSKVGIAISTLGRTPVNGLRHKPTESTNGWYLWCGTELSEDPSFFAPLHVEHLAEYIPEAVEYLDLPPGYRFLVDHLNHEDVWFDGALLEND